MTFPTRRQMLQRAAGGFGAIALRGLLDEDAQAGIRPDAADTLLPRAAHHTPKAKRVIFLYMTGGVSHVDSFDPKPLLFANHGKTITVDNWQGKRGEFTRYLKKPNWMFRTGGQCGTS